MNTPFLHLTLVTDKKNTSIPSYLELIQQCIKGGITCVQLREKLIPYEELLFFGRALKSILDKNHIPLIINDHVDLCIELDAAGVHLGQNDGDPIKARALLGPDKIIGISTNTITQVIKANALPIDYLGVGAIFPTENKPDVQTIWGLDGLKQAAQISAHPLVAIGGINENNAQSVIRSGANGIAAIGTFHGAKDPRQITSNLLTTINQAYHDR
ncbi:thiamine phosphate synthase [Legionella shakespearei]|uniref:Thiamine-phosphate synthase n=1 Tax=Legionella shakespearei DSM 23087 TaxID=1122169 RepID=A0A0W0Z640_9GAMM|nr:thiamine phosphate synthase [Legionella shakespearei]KTD64602.1 phosphomethylpyrimidine kinase/thiamin-phosphate pyrophosphorylase [Legionella shakespearei DSM 23087]